MPIYESKDVYWTDTRLVATYRLDRQHELLTKITENALVHPTILKDNIINVADIATGTG